MRNIRAIQHSDEYDSCYSFVDESESMEQSGIIGMKWGIRRWQNKDGSLTPAGRAHYGVGQARKVGLVEKARNAGIKKIFGEEKLNKQLDYERKRRAKRDVEKILTRDIQNRPWGSKADYAHFEVDRRDIGKEAAINNLIREIAKEDLNKILTSDDLRGTGLPKNIPGIIDEKIKGEKYQDYKKYLDEKYGDKEKKSLMDIFKKNDSKTQNNNSGDVSFDKWSKDIINDINKREVSIDSDGNYVSQKGDFVSAKGAKNLKEMFERGQSVENISNTTGLSETMVNDIVKGCHTNKYGDYITPEGNIISAKGAENLKKMYENGKTIEQIAKSIKFSTDAVKTIVGSKNTNDLKDDNKDNSSESDFDKSYQKYIDASSKVSESVKKRLDKVVNIGKTPTDGITEIREKIGNGRTALLAYDNKTGKKAYAVLKNEDMDALDGGYSSLQERDNWKAGERRAKQMQKQGYTAEEIAEKIGVSVGTVNYFLYESD